MSVHDLFLRACRRMPAVRPPVWMMRQAGRYLPQYRAVRAKADFLTMCRTPELAAEVTLQPIDLLGVDAAILFSDILIPLEPMGIRVEFNPAPVLGPPVRTDAEVAKLVVPDPEESVPFVYETIRILRRELEGRVKPLMGFGGAPLTLAAYMIEGGGSENFDHLKAMVYAEPARLHALLEKITATMERYLEAQVRAGAAPPKARRSAPSALRPLLRCLVMKPELARELPPDWAAEGAEGAAIAAVADWLRESADETSMAALIQHFHGTVHEAVFATAQGDIMHLRDEFDIAAEFTGLLRKMQREAVDAEIAMLEAGGLKTPTEQERYRQLCEQRKRLKAPPG